MHVETIKIIRKYYDAFNLDAMQDFFSLLAEDVVHEINHGEKEIGKQAFKAFMNRMHRHYKEKVVDLIVFANDIGTRAAAEFFIEGTYVTADEGLPPARGQKYRLRCGAFFEIKNQKIARVTNYYNLSEWLAQVK